MFQHDFYARTMVVNRQDIRYFYGFKNSDM